MNSDNKDYAEIIDRLTELRSRNNLSWMSLFKLALTNPATRPEAIEIAKSIFDMDQEILSVARELYE